MKKFLNMLVLISTVVVINGCKLDITQELLSSELRDVAVNATTGLMSPMTIAIEIPSADKCAEYIADIIRSHEGHVSQLHP